MKRLKQLTAQRKIIAVLLAAFVMACSCLPSASVDITPTQRRKGLTLVMAATGAAAAFPERQAVALPETSGGTAYFRAGRMLTEVSTYMDTSGKVAIHLPDFTCMPFDDATGLALVKAGEDRYGYIDTAGAFAIEPIFDFATPFVDGHARVVYQGKAGIITPDGKYSVNPEYAVIGEFGSGMAPAARQVSGGLEYGYIDVNGNVILPFEKKVKDSFRDSLAVVEDGIIAVDGTYIFRFEGGRLKSTTSGWSAGCESADYMRSLKRSGEDVVMVCLEKIPGSTDSHEHRVHVFNGTGEHVLTVVGVEAYTETFAGTRRLIVDREEDYEEDGNFYRRIVSSSYLWNPGSVPVLENDHYERQDFISGGFSVEGGILYGKDHLAIDLPACIPTAIPDSAGLIPVQVWGDSYRFYNVSKGTFSASFHCEDSFFMSFSRHPEEYLEFYAYEYMGVMFDENPLFVVMYPYWPYGMF